MTSVSFPTAYVVGPGTAVSRRAVMTRCSRTMSCAVASTWPSGGRRTMTVVVPSPTSYVRLDLPPATTRPVSRPSSRPGASRSRKPRSASSGSPGGSVRSASVTSVLRSAGDVDDLAGDEAGLLAREEGGRGGDVLGLADAGDGDLLGRPLEELLEGDAHALGGLARHVGRDEARRDGVGRDAELPELDGEGLREALETGLGGGVVGLPAVAERGGGAEVDDAAELRVDHVLLRRAGHEERAAQVDVHDGVPVVGGHLEEHVAAADAGVVDEDRRGAELGGDALDRGLHPGLVGDVDTHGETLAAGGLDVGYHCGAGRLVQVEDGDGIPVGGEALGDSGADAARGAGDDGGALGGRVGGGRLVAHACSWVEVVEVWWSSFCWSRFMPASQASGWAARWA